MYKVLFSVCVISLLSACSGPAIKDTALIQQTALNQAQNSQQDPQQAIASARDLQVRAQQQDLYFYSPTYMAQGEKEIALAEDALKQNKPASVVITHSLTAEALFKRGLSSKETVVNQLKPSFDGIAMLKEINTHALLKDDFKDIEDDVNELIILIEQNKTNEAIKDQQDVLADITKLEIETLKTANLKPAETALEKAEDADAEDFAAKTFETAEKAVEKLEHLIEQKYKDRQLIADTSKATIRLAQHAENVAKAAKPLLTLDNEKAEQHILYVESLLNRITTALQHEDVSFMPLNNQSIALAQGVETLSKQAQTNQNNPKWAKEKQALEANIAELKKQLAEKTAKTENHEPVTTTDTTDTSNVKTTAENTAATSTAPVETPTAASASTLPETATQTEVQSPEADNNPTVSAEPVQPEPTTETLTDASAATSEPAEDITEQP